MVTNVQINANARESLLLLVQFVNEYSTNVLQ